MHYTNSNDIIYMQEDIQSSYLFEINVVEPTSDQLLYFIKLDFRFP